VKTRLCIDCSPLLVRSAGVKTWLANWVEALRLDGRAEIHTLLEPAGRELILQSTPASNAGRLFLLQAFRALPAIAVGLASGKTDVFHASNLIRKVPPRRLATATLHDLTAWRVPQFHKREQVRADMDFARCILARADGVIAVSENSKRDAVEILRLNPEKIHVIYPGVAEEFFLVTQDETRTALAAVGIRRPYFLLNATIEPRKNIGAALDAWNLLPPSVRSEVNLIVAGMVGWNCRGLLERIQSMDREGTGVRYVGFVSARHLPGLTRGAIAMLYPSFYEGFGLPVAQAMACGCPVITSNSSSLPEVTAGAALLVDPHSPGEIAAAMQNVLTSEELRGKLRADGKSRANQYRWKRAADESVRFFAAVVGRVPPNSA